MKWFEDDSKPLMSEEVKAMSLEQLLVEIAKKEEKLRNNKHHLENRPRPAKA
jgi:hypothetical protein